MVFRSLWLVWLRCLRQLTIITEEIRHLLHRALEHFDTRQIDDAEVVRILPIETGALHNEQLFVVQQVEGELFVVVDVELLRVDLREDIERGLWLDGGDAVDGVERLIDVFALLVEAAAGHQIIIDALMPAERGLHDGLRGHV